jgi:hypothetical protein
MQRDTSFAAPATRGRRTEPAAPAGRRLSELKLRGRALARDTLNRLRYGPHSPRQFQLLYCDPADIAHCLTFDDPLPDALSLVPAACLRDWRALRPIQRRVVAGGDWDLARIPIAENRTVARTHAHLKTGASWRAVGEIDRTLAVLRLKGQVAGCHSPADVARRYNALDALIADVRRSRRLKERREIDPRAFRELGGIRICVARDGRLLKSGQGLHRLAIAQFFALPAIPVCLEAVHEDCLTNGRFAAILRRSGRLRASTLARPEPTARGAGA